MSALAVRRMTALLSRLWKRSDSRWRLRRVRWSPPRPPEPRRTVSRSIGCHASTGEPLETEGTGGGSRRWQRTLDRGVPCAGGQSSGLGRL